MIRHTVAFTLKHNPRSEAEIDFLEEAKKLADIPAVENFEQFRQVSPKNSHRFGFSMEFADRDAYESYNDHPIHVTFVRDRWVPEVADFSEADYEPLDG